MRPLVTYRDFHTLTHGQGWAPQVTQISGGIARNQVPDRCEFFVDIRTTPAFDHDQLAAAIDAELESEVQVWA